MSFRAKGKLTGFISIYFHQSQTAAPGSRTVCLNHSPQRCPRRRMGRGRLNQRVVHMQKAALAFLELDPKCRAMASLREGSPLYACKKQCDGSNSQRKRWPNHFSRRKLNHNKHLSADEYLPFRTLTNDGSQEMYSHVPGRER